MCNASKAVAILHGRVSSAFAGTEEPGKGHVYIGKERNYLAMVKLHIIAFARTEELERSQKGNVCIGKESSDVAGVKLQIIDFASRKESERSSNAMLQGEEQCCKCKVAHNCLCKDSSIEKEGTMLCCKERTMLQDDVAYANKNEKAQKH